MFETILTPPETFPPATSTTSTEVDPYDKLTTSKLARKMGIKTKEFNEKLIAAGLLENKENKPYLTEKGKAAGGEFRMSHKFGPYYIWPTDLDVERA